jgi:hypothetical protein
MHVNEETGRGEAWGECGVAEVWPRTWANAYPNAWAEIYAQAIAESQGKCGYADASRFIKKKDNRRNSEDS